VIIDSFLCLFSFSATHLLRWRTTLGRIPPRPSGPGEWTVAALAHGSGLSMCTFLLSVADLALRASIPPAQMRSPIRAPTNHHVEDIGGDDEVMEEIIETNDGDITTIDESLLVADPLAALNNRNQDNDNDGHDERQPIQSVVDPKLWSLEYERLQSLGKLSFASKPDGSVILHILLFVTFSFWLVRLWVVMMNSWMA
jgi:hypothetical protein